MLRTPPDPGSDRGIEVEARARSPFEYACAPPRGVLSSRAGDVERDKR